MQAPSKRTTIELDREVVEKLKEKKGRPRRQKIRRCPLVVHVGQL
jgi:hypothetical protein